MAAKFLSLFHRETHVACQGWQSNKIIVGFYIFRGFLVLRIQIPCRYLFYFFSNMNIFNRRKSVFLALGICSVDYKPEINYTSSWSCQSRILYACEIIIQLGKIRICNKICGLRIRVLRRVRYEVRIGLRRIRVPRSYFKNGIIPTSFFKKLS